MYQRLLSFIFAEEMRKKFGIAATFIVGTICLALPFIFEIWRTHTALTEFHGVVAKTEVIINPASTVPEHSLGRILRGKPLDNLLIHLTQDNGEQTVFMMDLYPACQERLQTIKAGDTLTLWAEADVLNRGRCFPHRIQRDEETLITPKDVKAYYWSHDYRWFIIIAAVLYSIGGFELFWLRYKRRQASRPETSL